MEDSAFAPWDGDPDVALAIASVLRRVGSAAGVHIYELEVLDGGGYRCRVWIGDAVSSLLGPIPADLDPEQMGAVASTRNENLAVGRPGQGA